MTYEGAHETSETCVERVTAIATSANAVSIRVVRTVIASIDSAVVRADGDETVLHVVGHSEKGLFGRTSRWWWAVDLPFVDFEIGQGREQARHQCTMRKRRGTPAVRPTSEQTPSSTARRPLLVERKVLVAKVERRAQTREV